MRQLTQRGWGVLAAGALVVALTLVVTLAVVVGGRSRDAFDRGSVAELTNAFKAQGLAVCASSVPDTGTGDGGSTSRQVLSIALPAGCRDDRIDVRVDAYADQAHRDAAARNAEAQDRAHHFGVVYTWHQYTVYLQSDDASGDPAVRNRIVDALDAVGAR